MNADFLKDVIPYRCPKCGDSRKFTSLRDLKLHLNSEHAFKVGCVKPRTRTSIFDQKGHNSRKKATNQQNLNRQWSSSLDSRRSSSESYGRDSPLFHSYKEDLRMIENRLENAREFERRNNNRTGYMSRSNSYDPLDSALNKLNKEVMNSRKNHWQSTDALYNAEEVMTGVETAAEERFQNQQNIIQNLVDNLHQREMQLTNANQDIQKLRTDKEKLMCEVEDLFKNADFGNKKLLQELEAKEKELNSVNNQLAYLKQRTSDEMKQKDEKLMEAERSLRQLEYDRKALEDEREKLMDKVQMDSGLLRKTLEMKENQVRKLNMEMEFMKNQQEELLSESQELYSTADHGTSKLKEIVRLRDKQLNEAEEELNRLKQLNERLIWESRQLTEQADSHSEVLYEALRQREDELATVKQELQLVLQTDRPKAVNEHIEELQQIVQEKTALLEQKEKELQSLKLFLTSTAEKEAVAREKLEKFISDLIDRADKAEKQLEYLKQYIAERNLGEEQEEVKHEGRIKSYTGESSADDVDSDDEMSDDDVQTEAKPSPIHRQAPVQKIKSGYPGKGRYKSVDNTFPCQSPCDSGYHDSKMASPRSSNQSTMKDSDYLTDINLRTKFSSALRGHQVQEGQQNFINRDNRLPDIEKHSHNKTAVDTNEFSPERKMIFTPESLSPVNSARYPNVEKPNVYVPPVRSKEKHPNSRRYVTETSTDLNSSCYMTDTHVPDDDIVYVPFNKHSGQPVEQVPRRFTYSRSNSSDDILSPSHQYRALSPETSLQNSRSISDYHKLPIKPSQSNVPDRPSDYSRGLSSSERQAIPNRTSDYGRELSSSERLALPNRNIYYGRSVSSTERQRLPGQSGDNSLSDVLSITDYVSEPLQSENNSFQKIMDENGILWDGEIANNETTRCKPRQNNYTYNNTKYKPQGKLKMSDKYLEEKKQFSENLKRIMKMPFLRESGNQAELTDDTLRYKLGKVDLAENKNNFYKNNDYLSDRGCNSQLSYSVNSLDRDLEVEPSTKDCATQVWIIDRHLLDEEITNTSSSGGIIKNRMDSDKYGASGSSQMPVSDRNFVDNETSPRNCSKTDSKSFTDSETKSSTSYTKFPSNNGGFTNKQKLGTNKKLEDGRTLQNVKNDQNSKTSNDTSYSKLPNNKVGKQQKKNLQNNREPVQPDLIGDSLTESCFEKPLYKNNQNKNDKSRDLFDELKKESLMEDKGILVPTPSKAFVGLNSDNMLMPQKVTGQSQNKLDHESVSIATKSPSSEMFDSSNSGPDKSCIGDEMLLNQQNNIRQSDNSIIASENSQLLQNEVLLADTIGRSLMSPVSVENDVNSKNTSSVVFSPQMSEDFEIIDSQTEEEIDSVIYDRSTDSLESNKLDNQNNSMMSDAAYNDGVMSPQSETMVTSERRKSLSRQLSMDIGRKSGIESLEQLEEHNIEPLGMMDEESLTPECLDKTFFAQPETEIEDDYPHSVSSMDGLTLSRSSSVDSLLSERMSHYSKRETTRKRRHALCHIFSFLDTPSLINVALVCKEWKKISRHPSLWKHVYLKNQKCSVEFLLNISKWCSKMTTLHIEGLLARDKKDFETEEEYIRRTRAILEPGLEKLLQVSESTLKSASIIHCENIITDKGLWLVSCYSRMVRNVTYICNTDLPGADVIWALGAGCRDITYLNISLTDPSSAVGVKFNNKCLQIISQFCQDIQTLCIGGTEIDINGLVLIAKSCQRLKRLEIHYGNTVSEDTMVAVCRLGLHNLQQIYFNFTPVEAKAILHLCKSSKQLQKIQISMDISCFDLKGEIKEDDRMKKYSDMVKNLKELEKKPGVGNILKLNCGEVFINTEKKFFGLF